MSRISAPGLRRVALMAIAALILPLAACSTAASQSSTGSASTATTSGTWPASPGGTLPLSYPTLAQYQAAVAAAEAPVKWQGPTVPVKPPKNAYIAAIGCAANFSGCTLPLQAAAAAAKAAGVKFTYTNVTNPQDYDQAVQTAILNGATAIFYDGGKASLIPVGLKQAQQKHIPVVSAFNDNPETPGLSYEVDPDGTAEGQALADAIIANTNGKPDVLFMNDNEYGLPVLVLDAAMKQLQACTICHVTFAKPINFTSAVVNTTLPTTTVSALRADPSINAVLIGYDPPTTYLIPAINSAGLKNRAPFYSQLGETLQYISTDNDFKNDTGASVTWAGYAAIDELFRALDHQPFVLENIPFQMFDTQNVPAGNAPFTGESSSNYVEHYLQLWGVSN
jgi:ribose transport system substrate-binding protein